MNRKGITIYEVKLNDGVIQQLMINDSDDSALKEAIDEYIDNELPDDVEIFQRGNDFVVCENAVYIAEYQ